MLTNIILLHIKWIILSWPSWVLFQECKIGLTDSGIHHIYKHHIYKLKQTNKKETISTDAEKSSWKRQNPFLMKIVWKLGTKGLFFNLMKDIYEKSIGRSCLMVKDWMFYS